MKDFERDYRKWSMVALISVVIFLFTIATIDAFLGFDFSRNMYVMSIVATGCVLALLSLTWIRILNCKLMKSDFWGNDETEEKDKRAESLATVEETPKCISMSDVEMCIRKEGYIPQTEEERVFFKIAGERFEVYYQDEKFTLVKRYCLGDDVDMDAVLKNLQERDYIDSHREASPLTQAPDAIVLDNSHMNMEQQMEWLKGIIAERFGK